MARKRKNNSPQTTIGGPASAAPGRDAGTKRQASQDDCQPEVASMHPRVLVVATCPDLRDTVANHLGAGEFEVCLTDTASDAQRRLTKDTFDAVIVQIRLEDCEGSALIRRISKSHPTVCPILVSDRPTLDEASIALRSGAADLLAVGMSSSEFVDRIADALRRSGVAKDREQRIRKLRKACRELNKAREIVSSQVGSLCDDLAAAYQDLTDRVSCAAAAAEFNSLVRQELDLESLLRVALEYVLAKAGPTNAAIFLPASSGDFSLGAYINYDGPKDSAETLLEHLSCTIAPRLEQQTDILQISGREQMLQHLGPEADWIDESEVLAFSCRDQGECLAVVLIHRSVRTPFPEAFTRQLPSIAEHFGQQLSRIIHVHHRHLPKDKWGFKPGSLGEDPDIDLAA
ncbi:MAG: response regulator [Phycisphaerales bacterium]|nr:response regulator [Phycisphaerales bacterium]